MGFNRKNHKGRKIYSSKLKIISMNDEYINKEIKKDYDKIKYQLFSIVVSEVAQNLNDDIEA